MDVGIPLFWTCATVPAISLKTATAHWSAAEATRGGCNRPCLAPQNPVPVGDEAGETLAKLIEVLDDHDDTQNVYGNYELSDALMAKLAG